MRRAERVGGMVYGSLLAGEDVMAPEAQKGG